MALLKTTFPTILKPTVGKHEGSCFRELLDLWSESGFCRVIPNFDTGDPSIEETLRPQARPWMNGFENILLYDNTILDKLEHIKTWQKGLFANEVLKKKNCHSWIFWPRFPRAYYSFVKTENKKDYDDRKNESIFIGNNTTSKRIGYWEEYTSFYFMGNMSQNNMHNMKFNYSMYLHYLQNSKFGLCLPGVGPKCLRDVEYMGLGTVPIFTPGVSTDYYDKLEQDKHYLFASSPEQIQEVINNCSKQKWEQMSFECEKWFERNCSLGGSFEQTMKIIEEM